MNLFFKILSISIVVAIIVFGIYSYLKPLNENYISKEEAVQIAKEDAKLKDIQDLEVEFKKMANQVYYEIDFEANFQDYEYNIDATNGNIIYRELH